VRSTLLPRFLLKSLTRLEDRKRIQAERANAATGPGPRAS